jgi:hypothetical protein
MTQGVQQHALDVTPSVQQVLAKTIADVPNKQQLKANRTVSGSCADELDGKYEFMKQVGAADHTVFYVYGEPMAESLEHQFFVFSSESGSGKYGVKDKSGTRHLNYFVVKGAKCLEPSDNDCITDRRLFPGQKKSRGGNKPGAGHVLIIGFQGMYRMKDTYSGSHFGLGNLRFSLINQGKRMVATTEDGCTIGRVNVCSAKNGKPSELDVYDQKGGFCKTIRM